jgi:riboflavin kinase / FMN adenylyltransferase
MNKKYTLIIRDNAFSSLFDKIKCNEDIYTVATVGSYDGLHVGHQKIIKRLNEIAAVHRNSRRLVISFYPHPSKVLGKNSAVQFLSSLRQECSFYSQRNIDIFYLIQFTKNFSSLSAEAFIKQYLIEKLSVKYLLIGQDAAFGKEREAAPKVIQQIAAQFQCDSEIVEFEKVQNEKVSSRVIRKLIHNADLKNTLVSLGRPYSILAKVMHGKSRGKEIGFPTANLNFSSSTVIPPFGVYAVYTHYKGKLFQSILNIGRRPTFEVDGNVTLEVHLLDFPHTLLYREYLEVFFIEKVRDEKKFDSAIKLKEQIQHDIAIARSLLTENVEKLIKQWLFQ